MLNNLTNFFNLITGRMVKKTPEDSDLIVLGTKHPKYGGGYAPTAIKVEDLATYINRSVEGPCPITLNYKPGSVGDIVSFVKPNNADYTVVKDVIIPGELEITRGNTRGIFNIALEANYNNSTNISPLNTFWCSPYTDTAANILVPLGDIPDRTYDNWRNAVDTYPPGSVGMTMIMKWDNGVDEPRYWVVVFTEWGIGDDGYNNFGYTRFEIFASTFFEQPDAGNNNTPQVIDIVSPGVHLARRYSGGGLYNILSENSANADISPENTEWNSAFTDSRTGYSGFTDLNNLESRIYSSFVNALDGNVGDNLPGTDLIMHDKTTDLYYKVVFDNWSQGCSENGYTMGQILSYTVETPGSGYSLNGNYNINVGGGTGTNCVFNITFAGGIPTINSLDAGGFGYSIGDLLTLTTIDVPTEYLTIRITDVCVQGGFSYTRTVIPQSCGIKFADGSILNTAPTTGGTTCCPVLDSEGNLVIDDNSTNTVNVGPGGTQLIPNFSGFLLVNDHYDGGVETWIAGGGDTICLGATNTGGGPVGSSLTISGTGYVWQNDSNMNGPFTFTVVKTRNEA